MENRVSNIYKNPEWREKADKTHVERGSAKRLHKKYRWLESLNYQEILTKVKTTNITEVAKELKNWKKRKQIDVSQTAYLIKCGYKVFRFWEHEIKLDVSKCVQQVVDYINSPKQ